jgi:hypothetical protein
MMPKTRKATRIQMPVDWKKDSLSLLRRHSRRPHWLRQQDILGGGCVSVWCAGEKGARRMTRRERCLVAMLKKTDSCGS